MSETGTAPYVRLAAGVEVVTLGTDAAVVGATATVRLAGSHAEPFALRLRDLADGSRTLGELLAALVDLPADEVDGWLRELVAAGLLTTGDDGTVGSLLHGLGVAGGSVDFLRQARVAVVGLDGVGVAAAVDLAAYGFGEVVLVDPFPLLAEDLPRLPGAGAASVGRPRQDVVADLLRGGATAVVTGPDRLSDRAALGEAVEGCRAVVCAADGSFVRVAQWANQVALTTDVPTVFGGASGRRGVAGPLVFPGEGPCFLCWRMRELACADDFEVAMAVEEAASSRAVPAGAPALPSVVRQVGGMLSVELVKTLTAVDVPSLVGAVYEVDGLDHTVTRHRVLWRPDCPACRKKDRRPRPQPTGRAAESTASLAALRDELVSARCGLVRRLDMVPKDQTEPVAPYVVRAELANQAFRERDREPFQHCSGKGMTPAEAAGSALGEACERYAGSVVDLTRLRRARRADLDVDSLDPADLVLYAADQYADLPYTPWDPDAEIGWIDGYDVATGQPVALPALGVLLGYETSDPAEHLAPVTSNGLAAGATLDAAVLAAALEVVERDAFLLSWWHALPGTRIDPATVGDPVVSTVTASYARRGVATELYRLPTEQDVSVYAALGVDGGDGPAVVVGLGADLDDGAAARKAVLEVGQVRPALRARMREPDLVARRAELVADPSRVTTLEDHDLLYADPSMLDRFAFWRDQPAVAWSAPRAVTDDRLGALVASLTATGHRLLACDLTAPELAAYGIHAARAVIPGFQPIHFGAREPRLGGTRLFELPARLGWRPDVVTAAGLRRDPHPLS